MRAIARPTRADRAEISDTGGYPGVVLEYMSYGLAAAPSMVVNMYYKKVYGVGRPYILDCDSVHALS